MGLILLISVSDISLLVYKHDFLVWILTLYPTVLPNSLTRSNSFLLESIGFSMYNVHYHVICKQWQFNPGLHGLSRSTVISPSYPHTNVGLPALPCPPPILKPLLCCECSPLWLPVSAPPTGLDECFFLNSLIDGLPYSLIFWQFWLFFDF